MTFKGSSFWTSGTTKEVVCDVVGVVDAELLKLVEGVEDIVVERVVVSTVVEAEVLWLVDMLVEGTLVLWVDDALVD